MEDQVIDMPVKPKREKKVKPPVRERKRRAQKGMVLTSKKLIREDNGSFVVQFPEELEEKYAPEILQIQGAVKPTFGYRIPYNPDGSIPEDQLTFLSVYKVRISEETLQLVSKFGKSNRFDFDSDIAVRAQMSSTDGKELEKMSYSESTTKLVLPKFQFGIDPATGKRLTLKPFQKAGILYALRARRTFIADEMGLGKTVEGFGTIVCDSENVTRDRLKEPWLIITPANLRINWFKEIRKWLPKKFTIAMIKNKHMRTRQVRSKKTGELRTVPTAATKEFLAHHQIFITTYDKLQRFGDILLTVPKWRGFIADESHYLKGRSTKRTIFIKSFVQSIDPEFILLLSGTPLMNKPMDLLSQLQVLDRLNDFGGHNHFLTRYCTMSTTDTAHVSNIHKAGKEVVEAASEENGNVETVDLSKLNTTAKQDFDQDVKDELVRKLYENMTALNKSLRSICYVRREKADVLKDLPEKQRQTLVFEINNRRDYEAIEADVLGYLADKVAKDEKFLATIKKFSKDKQEALIAARRAEKYSSGERAQALVRIENLKQCAAIGKMKAVKEWIEDFLESGKKLVVSATHNIILNELEAMFPDAVSIRSGMSPERRNQSVEAFQTNKKVTLILMGLKMAEGVTLTAASDTLTLEFGWNPAKHDQFEDRVHRIGQKESVTAYYAVASHTIEEKIGKLIEKKRRVVNAVADGDPLKDAGTGSVLGDLLGELTGGMGLYA